MPSHTIPRRTKVAGKGCENIYLARSGRYEIAYRSQGKLQWFSCPSGWTLAEAKAKRAELTIAKRDNTLALPSKLTVAQAAAQWRSENESEWAPNTVRSRESIIRLHINPVIGDAKLRDLTADHVWQIVLAQREKGASRAYQRLCVTVIGSLCSWLVDEKQLSVNPVLALSKNRRKQLSPCEKTKCKVIADEAALIRETRDPYRLIVKTALLTGLRLAEVLGLRVRDISETSLKVDGQLDRKTRSHTHRVKTPAARRSVRLPVGLRLELLAAVDGRDQDDLVFQAPDGLGFWQQPVERGFLSAAKRAGLDPSLTFHATRHTFASRLISEGRTVAYLQHELGHASPQVTLNTYVHLFEAQGQEDVAQEAADAAYEALSARPVLKLVAGGAA